MSDRRAEALHRLAMLAASISVARERLASEPNVTDAQWECVNTLAVEACTSVSSVMSRMGDVLVTPDQLPEGCDQPSCPDGVNWCFTKEDCAEDEFCLTGCCIPLGS